VLIRTQHRFIADVQVLDQFFQLLCVDVLGGVVGQSKIKVRDGQKAVDDFPSVHAAVSRFFATGAMIGGKYDIAVTGE
jgi:hypothetical protein